MVNTKTCPDCGEEKPLKEFSPFKKGKFGRYTYCRPCAVKRNASSAREHRGRINEYRARRYATDSAYREREKQRARESRQRNLEKREASRMLRQWSITPSEFQALLDRQGGGCAICRSPVPNGHGARHGIDHDHSCCSGQRSCGKCIRGVLCARCNSGLGNFDDDPKRLAQAIKYLRKTRR